MSPKADERQEKALLLLLVPPLLKQSEIHTADNENLAHQITHPTLVVLASLSGEQQQDLFREPLKGRFLVEVSHSLFLIKPHAPLKAAAPDEAEYLEQASSTHPQTLKRQKGALKKQVLSEHERTMILFLLLPDS